MRRASQGRRVSLISRAETNQYYEYLLSAFKHEFLGSSRRQLIEEIAQESFFRPRDAAFLRNIVSNAFRRKHPYRVRPLAYHVFEHPIELLDYIVQEGYTPSSPFVRWAHDRFGIKWNPKHWFVFLMRSIAPIDLVSIRKELRAHPRKKQLPETLEFYYRLGTGLERIHVHPDIGIRKVIRAEYQGEEHYKGFDPIDYLDYYYGGLDREDMTIARVFYETVLRHRAELAARSTALIVGNGPTPDEAQALAMIPEIQRIIPADVDERNINIMRMHTGGRNPLATQKARPGEEHADFIYYLFERHSRARYGFFAVREIAAVKTLDPVYVDVSRAKPLDSPRNSAAIRNVRADVVVVPFCPESITDNPEVYRSYLKNIASLVLPGRHLCMLALKDARFYISGRKKLDAIAVNERIVADELARNDFSGIEITTIRTGFNPEKRGFSDSMVIWATRK